MNIIIKNAVRDSIREKLGEDFPIERCGLLFGSRHDDGWQVDDWAEVPNASDDPQNNYDVSTDDAKNVAEARGFKESDIIGSVHTHRRGESPDPSSLDVINMPKGMLGIVLHIKSGRLTFFDNEFGFICKEDA